MPNGLDDLGLAKITHSYPPQSIAFSGLAPERVQNHPSKADPYQDVAVPYFNSIGQDYSRTKASYKASKRLDGFPVVLWDLKSFIKWVKAEAIRVAFEVKVSRRIRYSEEQWALAKQAFEAELDRLNQQSQKP